MCLLYGFFTCFAGPDPDNLFNRQNEDLAIANFSGFAGQCRLAYDGDNFFNLVGFDDEFQFYLGDKVDNIFGSTVYFLVAFLAPVSGV